MSLNFEVSLKWPFSFSIQLNKILLLTALMKRLNLFDQNFFALFSVFRLLQISKTTFYLHINALCVCMGVCVYIYIAMSIYKNNWALFLNIFLLKESYFWIIHRDIYGAIFGKDLDVKYLVMNPIKSGWQSIWAAIYRKTLLLLNLSLGYSSARIPQEGPRSLCIKQKMRQVLLTPLIFFSPSWSKTCLKNCAGNFSGNLFIQIHNRNVSLGVGRIFWNIIPLAFSYLLCGIIFTFSL